MHAEQLSGFFKQMLHAAVSCAITSPWMLTLPNAERLSQLHRDLLAGQS